MLFIHLFRWAALTGLCTALVLNKSRASYSESISGLGLIGSHFGVPFFNATFDYVVIGGGTAGLTLATRLAQNSKNSVAVIEAGGFCETDNGNLSSIPAYNSYWVGKAAAERNPLIEWETFTEPIPGFGNQRILYSAGKTLGGGSSRNSITYHRSTTGAFQMWADLVGDNTYTFDKLLPYFKRSVDFQGPNKDIRPGNATVLYDNSANNASGGPLKVSYPNHANAFSSWAVLALKELGLKEVKGFMSGRLMGFQYTANTLDRKTQTRSSSETSFLRLALESTVNLNVYKSTLAKRILFDESKKATGVLVNTAGVEYILSASKEVILSAGALRSPQMLMVSGVGPESILQSLQIPTVVNRPGVGQNMQDHVLFGITYNTNVATHSRLQDPVFAAAQVDEFANNRTGVLTNSASELLGWEKLPTDLRKSLQNETISALDRLPIDWPELELIFPDGYGGMLNDFLASGPLDGKNYATIGVGLQALFSRGNVTINSTNTADNPIVSPNLLGDPKDMDLAVQALRRLRQIARTKAMKGVLLGTEAFPGEDVAQTDESIRGYLRKASNTIYHASCTNAMGKTNDSMAVVDTVARVIGVQGLRVVDASIFPFLPPGHPQSLVYALAEKIADAIQNS